MSARPANRGADAGRRVVPAAWLVWGLAAVNYAYAFFQRVNPSAMADELMRDFDVSAAALGNLAAAYFYGYALMQIPAGVAYDRWGPRGILAGASVCGAVGALMFALAGSIDLAVAGRLLIGAGAGFSYLGGLTLAMIWFPAKRYDVMVGLIAPFGIAGAVLGQAPFGALVEELGWRPAMLGLAGLAGLLAVLFWASRRVRPPGETTPLGPGASPRPHLLAGLGHALGQTQTWLLAVAGGAVVAPFIAFAALWAVPWLMQVRGFDRIEATGTTSIMLIGLAAGAPVCGWLSNRLRRRKPILVACTAGSLAAWLALLYLPGLSSAALYLLFAAIGAFSGGVVMSFVAARDRTGEALSGSVSAIINTFLMGGGALVQLLIGVFLDAGWDGRIEAGVRLYSEDAFRTAFLVPPLTAGLGLAAALLVRESHPARQPPQAGEAPS